MPTRTLCPKCHGQRTIACPICSGAGGKCFAGVSAGSAMEARRQLSDEHVAVENQTAHIEDARGSRPISATTVDAAMSFEPPSARQTYGRDRANRSLPLSALPLTTSTAAERFFLPVATRR
jgi:hypothetical protein